MMENVKYRADGETLVIELSGHIDSANAAEVESAVTAARGTGDFKKVVVDCSGLNYVSSAGLRVILRLKKAVADTSLINVSPEVYDILDVTGFTEMMSVQKAYRMISVEGCEVIGQGANGKVYRIDPDTIVKVYLDPDSIGEIRRERELARTAFVLGVPTAIPYDVVRIEGGGYGSVFEMLNADSFAKLLIEGKKTVDEIAAMSIELLKTIHSTKVDPETMPDMKAVAVGWAEYLKDYLPDDQWKKLCALIKAVPDDDHMLHGDYHLKNVMLQNGESILIDMDTLCHGHPIFELACMRNAYKGFSSVDHSAVLRFLGIPYETSCLLFKKMLSLYLGTEDDAVLKSVEDKAELIGNTRLMRRCIRRVGLDNEEGKAFIDFCKKRFGELLPTIDTLTF
ncbi:MAG: anti-sigma factor antagonist [Firmicutes bacterium]|nr:anti-sigma factor antagonist [Bacillota bacterium]